MESTGFSELLPTECLAQCLAQGKAWCNGFLLYLCHYSQLPTLQNHPDPSLTQKRTGAGLGSRRQLYLKRMAPVI